MGYVQAFRDGSAKEKDLLGGKGANLAEMTALRLPVPPGFTITTDACRAYLRDEALPEGLMDEVADELGRLEEEMGRSLGSADDPLLVSVRSGAAVSMPGMMDTILNLGLNDEAVDGLARQSGDERFARDAHRRLYEMFGEIVLGVEARAFRDARAVLLDKHGAGDPSELDAAALVDLVDAYRDVVREATGEDLPQDPRAQLELAVAAVFGSWNTPRAVHYRRMEGIPDDAGTAVNVQAMVFGNLGSDSATGVAFSRNPSTGENRHYGDWLPDAQGEDVVAGIRATKDLGDLAEAMPDVNGELADILERLEQHYADMQDVEFTVERGTLWILQTRTGKRSARAALRMAVELAQEGLIDRGTAIHRVTPAQLDQLLHPQFDPEADYEVLASGLAASPGAATGQVVFTADEAQARAGDGDDVVLVRPDTSPEDVHGMSSAVGVLTSRGGLVSHAAIVARSIGKPAVCGAADVEIDLDAGCFRVGDTTVAEGDVISLDGTTGEIVLGEVDVVEPDPGEHFRTLLGWADEIRELGVRANADTAEDAATARELGAEGIGLCRTEHMFLDDRVGLIRQVILAADDDEAADAIAALEDLQTSDFVALLEVMDGLPVTVRLLDPPLHEFLPDAIELEISEATGQLDEEGHALLEAARAWREVNPMLGLRGVRLGLMRPGLYRMQVRALITAALRRRDDGGDPKVEIMIPLVATASELEVVGGWVREAIAEAGGGDLDVGIGTMIETPRAALTAGAIAGHAEFFSFGTNDLTQLTFGFSRDDVAGSVIEPYLERGLLDSDPFVTMDPDGVGELLRRAVADGRAARPDLELGVCGEHGADPASVALCQEIGMDYVSCSPYRIPVARLAAAQAVQRG